MNDNARFQLVDASTGEILFDEYTCQVINPRAQRQPDVKHMPGVKAYKGGLMLLRIDFGTGWQVVDSFTNSVQLETFEQHGRRVNRISEASSFPDFCMVDGAALNALDDADAFRFLMLLARLHVTTGIVTGIDSVEDYPGLFGMTRSNTYTTLNRLQQAGLIRHSRSEIKVLAGIYRRRKPGALIIFRGGLMELCSKTLPTKHGYLGRLFKNVSGDQDGMVRPKRPDSKAKSYCESLLAHGYPILWKDEQGYILAPSIAFFGKPQNWSIALNSVSARHGAPSRKDEEKGFQQPNGTKLIIRRRHKHRCSSHQRSASAQSR